MFIEDEHKVKEIVAQAIKEAMQSLRDEMKAMAVKPEVEKPDKRSVFKTDPVFKADKKEKKDEL